MPSTVPVEQAVPVAVTLAVFMAAGSKTGAAPRKRLGIYDDEASCAVPEVYDTEEEKGLGCRLPEAIEPYVGGAVRSFDDTFGVCAAATKNHGYHSTAITTFNVCACRKP